MVTVPELARRAEQWWRTLPGGPNLAGGRRSGAGWLADSALFVFAAGLGGVTLVSLWHTHGAVLDVIDLVVGVLACLALWARRSSPAAVFLVIAAGGLSPGALGASLVAVFTAASRMRGRALVLAAVLTAASGFVFPVVNPSAGEMLQPVFPAFLVGVVCFGWGLYVRAQRERADRLEADQRRSADVAREAERRRIAREMHDVLAHRLSLLSVHAGALEFRPDAPAQDIARAAGVIRTAATAALSELRQVITVLREDGSDGAEPPQPALAQLPDLLAESRSAGMALRARIDVPDADSVPTSVGLAAYRVVQEGLTNARKHAPGGAVEVTVTGSAGTGLVAEVISRHSGGVPWPGDNGSAGVGAGLIGLAERLALVGGELEHGTSPAGDFVLRATIPGQP